MWKKKIKMKKVVKKTVTNQKPMNCWPKFMEYVKRRTNLPRGRFCEILGLEYNLVESEDEQENRVVLNERQMFWNHILNVGQWLLLGKDIRDCMEYEQTISELSSDISARLQFSTNMITNTAELSAEKKSPLKKPIQRTGRSRIQNDYYHFLHVDDVFPESCRGYTVGNIASDIDVQALELAVNELIDEDIPFNAKRFIHYIEPSQVEYSVNSLSLDVLSHVFNIKKNMLMEDWIRIKNLYVELKMKNMVEIKKVCSQVLTMAIQSFPPSSAASWYNKIGNKRKLSALKLGTLFLTIFHVCYMEANREMKINSLKDINGNFNLGFYFANQEDGTSFEKQIAVIPKQTQTVDPKPTVKKSLQQRPRMATATQQRSRLQTENFSNSKNEKMIKLRPGNKVRLVTQDSTKLKRKVPFRRSKK